MSQTKISSSLCRVFCIREILDIKSNLRNIRHQSSNVKKKTASSVYKTMNIFDRKAKVLQRERSARSEDYHLYEYVKEEIGWRTADRIFDIKRTFKNAVELGAGRGYVSRHFLPDSVEKVTLCDSSQTHLDKAIIGDDVKYEKIVMDEENFDVFVACVFGSGTLMELRQAIQLAEMERLGGMHQHVSPFTGVRDLGGLMNAAGFTLQTVDVDSLTVWYPSAWDVMKDVRMSGEGAAAVSRPIRLRKDVQFAAAAIYDEMYGKEIPDRNTRGVPATFQIINFLGWKPDPSQPKPMERGSGEMSLKDLHRIDEIIQDTKKIELTDDKK
ncbi:unnamed protein product [Danaus chrysippus]|uniref:(African queen) hypothetical protein n=1 Tax=Danaus chrysippus TaxID=151541 RepID=A0A8J2R0T5_9NEOP|nr:unnamed protein product [Danaus chrysippus]